MGGRSRSEVTETRIDPRLVPYVEQGLGAAQNLFQTGQLQFRDPTTGQMTSGYVPQFFPGQTYVGPTDYTSQAIQSAANLAQAGTSPLVQQAQQSVQQLAAGQGPLAGVASGQMLGYNPYLQGTLASVARPIEQQFQSQIANIASQASRAGRYGSGAMGALQGAAAESLASNLAGLGERLGFQSYGLERQLQGQAQAQQQAGMLQAAQLAPALAEQDYASAQRLLQAGQMQERYAQQALQDQINRYNFEQQAPFRALQQYSSFLSGFPAGAQQAAPSYTNPAASLLGGAALVSAFGQPGQASGGAGKDT